MSVNIAEVFFRTAERHPERPALDAGGEILTYAALRDRALSVAAALRRVDDGRPFAALFAQRTPAAYAGILGILAAGKAFVPLNPRFPDERTRRMLHLSGCTSLVAGPEVQPRLARILGQPAPEGSGPPPTVILPTGTAPAAELTALRPCLVCEPIAGDGPATAQAGPEAPAYLLFTSGSTGLPKGVAVSHGNVRAYLDYVAPRYGASPEDRFSQMFDLTFDLSMHDMFVCYSAGGCLCVPREESVMAPGRFVRDKRLTMWFSVPSTAIFMSRLGMLKPGAYPDLKVSLFCGEPLPAATAAAWQAAAPQSRVENLYGPTEATIAITHYTWTPGRSEDECENGLTPIGCIFDTQDCMVRTADGRTAAPGETGELLLAGSQVTGGYLDDPEKTARQFVSLDGDGRVWYRTGDLVRLAEDGVMHYLSRLDHQVKIRGYRVELAEIEHAARTFSGAAYAVAVPFPLRQGLAESLVLALHGAGRSGPEILAHCRDCLPEYMVPARVLFLDSVPLNSNGKIDRAAVGRLVESA